jgi:hypothetical protein
MRIFFCIVVWQGDFELSKRLIQSLRLFHPDSQILVISDGAELTEEYVEFCTKNSVFLSQGIRLKQFGRGGLWLKRNFEVILHFDFDVVFQLEPDVYVTRTLLVPQNLLDLAATKLRCNAFLLYRRETLRRILDSGILDNPERFSNCNYEKNGGKFVANDQILPQIIEELQLKVSRFPMSLWIKPNGFHFDPSRLEHFSAIHPWPL